MFAKLVFQLSLAHSGQGVYGTDQTLLQTAAGICPAPAPLGPGTRLRQPHGSAGETIHGSPGCLGPRAKAEANTGVLGGPSGVTSSSHSPLPNSKGLPPSLELPDLVSTHPLFLPMNALQVNFSILSLAWARVPILKRFRPEEGTAAQHTRGASVGDWGMLSLTPRPEAPAPCGTPTTSPQKDAPSISHRPPNLSASRNTETALGGSESEEGDGRRHEPV